MKSGEIEKKGQKKGYIGQGYQKKWVHIFDQKMEISTSFFKKQQESNKNSIL